MYLRAVDSTALKGLRRAELGPPPQKKSSASDSSAASCHFPSFPVAKVYDRKASSWSARKGLAELVSRFLPGQGTHGSVSASSFRSASVELAVGGNSTRLAQTLR